MELADKLVAIAIGTLIGFGIVAVYVGISYYGIKRRVDRVVQELLQEAEANLVGLDIEVDQNTYFCYNTTNKQFVCQGATVSEIRQAFQARFPGKTAYLAGGDEAVVAKFKQELLTLGLEADETNNTV